MENDFDWNASVSGDTGGALGSWDGFLMST
jgi:hypothetical protein